MASTSTIGIRHISETAATMLAHPKAGSQPGTGRWPFI
jgi:hypothetical protein